MNLSAELIESFKLARSRNYYKEPGIYGATTRTSRHMLDRTKRRIEIKNTQFEVFIELIISLFFKIINFY
jgi:hypothetical protein